MVGGQAIDLDGRRSRAGPARRRSTRPRSRTCIARKTGALIRAAATLGAIAVGAGDARIAAIDDYARELGLAFQIVDDVLDVEGIDGGARKDRRQGCRGRQADLSRALRARRLATAGDGSGGAGKNRADGWRAPRPAGGGGGLVRRAPSLTRRSASPRGTVKGVPKARLDQLLVTRGLLQSRERARAHILAGDVDRRRRADHESRHAGR